jgi:antitoxin component YwqK of YwqJK toxin-antitoxin module
MNKVVLVLISITIGIFFTACNNSGRNLEGTEVISSYANNQPQIERDYKMVDGKRLAVYEREYYEDGNLLKEGALSNSEKRDGLWKSYHRDGVIWSEGAYIDGIREGTTITYFANGNKYYEGQFAKAKKVGVWKFWTEDGEFEKEINFDTTPEAGIKVGD